MAGALPAARDLDHAKTVVLVGPLAAGKTTLGSLIAERTGRPFIDIDEISWDYGREVGWDLERLLERDKAVGWVESEREWEPARAHAVERVLADHPGAVIAFGAGYTSFTEPQYADRVRAALAQVPHVIHLLPSPDPERSVAILRARAIESRDRDWIIEGHDFIAQWVAEVLPAELATMTVYTDGSTVTDSAEQIVRELAP